MRVGLLSIAVLMVFAVDASAQELQPECRTAVYAEALGPTEFASLNVERLFGDHWSARIGAQVAGSGRSLGQHYLQVPVSLSHMRFLGPVGFEAGAGLVGTINPQYAWGGVESFVSGGLRSRPLASGVFLRAELVAFPTQNWLKQIGFGVGVAF